MKIAAALCLAVSSASAFVAPRQATVHSRRVLYNQVTDITDEVVSKTEEVLDKADDIFVKRAMRVVDHAPIVVTLKGLASAAGATSKWGIDMAPAATVASPLAIPGWTASIWSLMAVAQLASCAKSALAEGGNELSQSDITTTAVANVMAAKAIGGASSNPLLYTALTAVASGYAARRGNADGAVSVHNAALQLMSSFTTVLTVMGGVSAITDRIGLLAGRTEIVTTLAVGAYYLLVTRNGNSTVKKTVNAGVLGGYMWSRLASSGISFSTSSLLSVSLVASAAVTFVALKKVKEALLD